MNVRVWIAAAFAGLGLLALSRRAARYLHPVPGARVTSPFGWRIHPVTGRRSFHNGVDFAVPIGTPILSPDTGTVTAVYNEAAGGLSMVVTFADLSRAGFAHLHRTALGVGDIVQRGETIALSGASGNATGPSLHFTLNDGTQYVDPLLYLPNA
jgi:murein DD-endopeptidase MepM/ murein hydrolase activator NlpD